MNVDAVHRRVEIGSTWYARARAAHAAQHRVQAAAARRTRSTRSTASRSSSARTASTRRAGARSSASARSSTASCARTSVSADGTLRDTAVYSITAAEWPTVRLAPRLAARKAALTSRLMLTTRWWRPLPWRRRRSPSTTCGSSSAWAAAALSPDGAQAAAAVTRHSMDDNKSHASTLAAVDAGRRAARADAVRRQGRPAALVSPRGDLIALHRQARAAGPQGRRAAALRDRARRRRGAPRGARVATGVEAFRWFPDGQRIAFVSWVWPDAEGRRRRRPGGTRRSRTARKPATSPARRCTATGTTTLPMGRVAAPARAGRRQRPRARPVRRQRLRADARRARRQRLRHLARRPAHRVRVRPAPREALRQPLRAGRDRPEERPLRRDRARRRLELRRTALQPRRPEHRVHRQPRGPASTRCRPARGLGARRPALDTSSAPSGTTRCTRRCSWDDDGQALLFTAEQQGRSTCGASTCPTARAEVVVPGGWVLRASTSAAGTLVTVADAADHPARVHAHACRAARRAASSTSTTRCWPRIDLGRHEEVWFKARRRWRRRRADVADLPARLRREEDATRCCT